MDNLASSLPSGSAHQRNSVLEALKDGVNNDTVQKLAMLTYVSNPEMGKPIMQGLLVAQLLQKAHHHLSGEDAVEALRQETIMNIATYIKDHPRARPNEIQMKVEDEINLFKEKLQAVI